MAPFSCPALVLLDRLGERGSVRRLFLAGWQFGVFDQMAAVGIEDQPMGKCRSGPRLPRENIVLAARLRDEMKTEPRHAAPYIGDRETARCFIAAVRIVRTRRPFVAWRPRRRRIAAVVVVVIGIGPGRRPVLCVCRKDCEEPSEGCRQVQGRLCARHGSLAYESQPYVLHRVGADHNLHKNSGESRHGLRRRGDPRRQSEERQRDAPERGRFYAARLRRDILPSGLKCACVFILNLKRSRRV